MNPALLIFTQIAIAGGAFLVYFFYAMHRELKNSRKSPKVEIRPVSMQPSRVKVIEIYTVAEGHEKSKRVKISGR